MNAVVKAERHHALAADGALAILLDERNAIAARIESIVSCMDGGARLALNYLLDAYTVRNRDRGGIRAEGLLDVAAGVAALDASYWQKAMQLTDVYDCMPQARRDEWSNSIHTHKTPPFTAETVVSTFEALLSSRAQFLAERVDGIFRALSRTHVTNQPEGFGKRMIIPYAWRSSFPESSTCGYINDLRAVIARFMGRGEPKWNSTSHIVATAAHRTGQWVAVDGGALRLRVYRGVGTAHIEVHPDMAWRLNAILASLHPAAIPASFRERPKVRKLREFNLLQRLLPFPVIELLSRMDCDKEWSGGDFNRRARPVPNTRVWGYGEEADKATRKQAEQVLAAIGGVLDGKVWRFDYDPTSVVTEIACSGCIPDAVSHQFYPTPEPVAAAVIATAGIEPGMSVLEPSAGQGAIADLLPSRDRLHLVEISQLHCEVLRAKGYSPVCADFMQWNDGAVRFDRVVMNPPYSEGRWRAHVQRAAALLAPGGRLVAVLPASARGKQVVEGKSHTWGEVFENAFEGTSIEVTLLTLEGE